MKGFKIFHKEQQFCVKIKYIENKLDKLVLKTIIMVDYSFLKYTGTSPHFIYISTYLSI